MVELGLNINALGGPQRVEWDNDGIRLMGWTELTGRVEW